MKFTKKDVAHIATFSEGAFKSWRDIVDEVKQFRLESDTAAIARADKGLMLKFD